MSIYNPNGESRNTNLGTIPMDKIPKKYRVLSTVKIAVEKLKKGRIAGVLQQDLSSLSSIYPKFRIRGIFHTNSGTIIIVKR